MLTYDLNSINRLHWFSANFTNLRNGYIYNPPQDPPDIIYQDAAITIVNKPANLLSVPGKAIEHADCIETRLRDMFSDTLLVHRLDMATSGVMVFARTKDAQRNLGLQFEKRHTRKIYIARVWGHPKQDNGHIDLPLTCDWVNKPKQKVCYERGKPSQTDWEVIEREDETTLMRLYPKTGRSHQLRVHMLELGHPIIGDRFYATGPAFDAADRMQLHAKSLTLRNPLDGQEMTFDTSVPF